MLSHSSKYAIKAIHFISKNGSSNKKLRSVEISQSTNIPKPFLSKLLKQLALLEIISSSKGPNGGFFLTEEQLQRTVLDIIVAIEGKDRFHQCVLNIDACNAEMPCPIHELVFKEKDALRNAIKKIKLLDLSDNLNYFTTTTN